MSNRSFDLNTVTSSNMNVVFEALPHPLVILRTDDPDFTVEKVNSAFLKLSGMRASDLNGKPFFKTFSGFFSTDFKTSVNRIVPALQSVISQKKIIETDILQFALNFDSQSDKRDYYLQVKCSPVLNKKGAVDLVVLALDDVTNLFSAKEKRIQDTNKIKFRKKLHNISESLAGQAAKSQAKYESASQELDDFVYSVSHDLRAPLRRVDGFSQELLNEYADKLDETGVHYLKRIRQGAQDMGQLIDDLLKLSRISRRKVERSATDLGKIANEVFKELQEEYPERNMELILGDNLEAEADGGLLRIVLTNLLSNAVKFSREVENTRIEIGSKNEKSLKIFYVKDNGVGFDPAYSEKLFKAFQRLHSQQDYDGTGIGLVTVKRIVSSHGGRVWAESTPGKGATFYFTLKHNENRI